MENLSGECHPYEVMKWVRTLPIWLERHGDAVVDVAVKLSRIKTQRTRSQWFQAVAQVDGRNQWPI
jgi:hypothetical protein